MAKKGETRERILNAAEKVFFEHGFEAASVKMILEEADVVTGSFYHFFPSKESLFEHVVERFLQDYTENVRAILGDDSLGVDGQLERFMCEIQKASATYYSVLQGNRLHWTIQHALHNKTVEALVLPLSELLERRTEQGIIEKRLDVDSITLAAILIKGTEAILHGQAEIDPAAFASEAVQRDIRAYVRLLLTVRTAE